MEFPHTIRTERLLLQRWSPGHARRLKDAIDANLSHLRAWVPWAMAEPSPIEVITARLEKFAAEFTGGTEWLYGVFTLDGQLVIGGCGLHPRIGADGMEIGYWIAATHTRRGLATEAADALTGAAFGEPSIERVQIKCDPLNLGSAGVPRRLGFRNIDTIEADFPMPSGEMRDTMVWEISRAEFNQRRAASLTR